MGHEVGSHESQLKAIATLEDGVRRRLFEYVREASSAVGREEAAEATGISRSLAAYHLDKLAELGLLSFTYERPAGRGGPGAGRPAKMYRPGEGEVAVTVPARDYELPAHLLALAVEGQMGREGLGQVAESAGREAGEQALLSRHPAGRREAVLDLLRARGYEPLVDEDGVIRLRNCPFHRLAHVHRELICGMNHAFLRGFLEGVGAEGLDPRLEPDASRCCVAINLP